jgi:hypothetical protein
MNTAVQKIFAHEKRLSAEQTFETSDIEILIWLDSVRSMHHQPPPPPEEGGG